MTDALGEVHMDPVVIYEDSLHFEVGLFAILLVFKLDEGVLEAVPGPLVSDDFA